MYLYLESLDVVDSNSILFVIDFLKELFSRLGNKAIKDKNMPY